MADDGVRFGLAVSLHSAIDETRSKMMPINDSSNLAELLESLQYWYEHTKSRVTFEYVVWKGINDQQEDIDALISYCKKVPSKVNLIEYNAIEEDGFVQADPEVIEQYQRQLEKNNITVNVRRSRGQDIDAACFYVTHAFVFALEAGSPEVNFSNSHPRNYISWMSILHIAFVVLA